METTESKISTLTITSSEFMNNSEIPRKYTCDGENISPPLGIGDLPNETISMVIIVDDPDAKIKTWTHWIMWNIKPTIRIKEDSHQGVEGLNDFKKNGYDGPCPPFESHRYFFKIYALDVILDLPAIATKEDLLEAMQGHILAAGEIMGFYKRD